MSIPSSLSASNIIQFLDNADSHGLAPAAALPRKLVRRARKGSGRHPKPAVPPQERVKLERVLGLTVASNASLSCESSNDIIAYPAGCTVVLYSALKNKQTHIVSSCRKVITCLVFSPDGRFLATGECGHQPAVRVWNVQERLQVAEFLGHKFGVTCVAFSPNLKYLVSVGTQHDMTVNVWNWRQNSKAAANKVSSKVRAVSFSDSGNYFVTVGVRHVKFWYLERCKPSPKYQANAVPLMGRSAILADQRNNNFVDVRCGLGAHAHSTFTITQSGLLCEFNSKRLLERWVELMTRSANALALSQQHIFVGCAEGVVRVFAADNLHFLASLPRPHHLGIDVAMATSAEQMLAQHPPHSKYPDTVALCYSEAHKRLSCVYSDHSLYQWDLSDLHAVGKAVSFLFHSGCVWGIQSYPALAPADHPACLPAGSFVTCAGDDTIRIWNLLSGAPAALHSEQGVNHSSRNVCCQELLKVFYVDAALQNLCEAERSDGDAATASKTAMLSGSTSNSNLAASEGEQQRSGGVRSIRISPDGCHLASGDRNGNVRVHRLTDYSLMMQVEAHDSEVLCLEYSLPDWGPCLFASASRDRLIHVFHATSPRNVALGEYPHLHTLDDHSSSITAVKFACHGGQLHLLSCSADKSLIFRQVNQERLEFSRVAQVVAKSTLYDMDVDPQQRNVYVACQDRQIRGYSLHNAKHIRSIKGALGDDGALIKLQVDPSGQFAAASCSDKSVAIWELGSGECVAHLQGHGELITGLAFSSDCRHLLTASGDSCVFVWRLSAELSARMQQGVAGGTVHSNGVHHSEDTLRTALDDEQTDESGSTGGTADYADEYEQQNGNGAARPKQLDLTLDDSSLPAWATRATAEHSECSSVGQQKARAAGKWASRVANLGSFRVASAPSDKDFSPSSPFADADVESFESNGNNTAFNKVNWQRGSNGTPDAREDFGSLADVHLALDDSIGASPAKLSLSNGSLLPSTPIIYFPPHSDSPSNDSSAFEVRERSEASRLLGGYKRSDSFAPAEGLSDDESDGVRASAPNLRSALADEHQRNNGHFHQLNPSAEQQTPPAGALGLLRFAYESLDQSGSNPSMLERGSAARSSISTRYLSRGGASGGLVWSATVDHSPAGGHPHQLLHSTPSQGLAPRQIAVLADESQLLPSSSEVSTASAPSTDRSLPWSARSAPDSNRQGWQPASAYTPGRSVPRPHYASDAGEQRAQPSWSYQPAAAQLSSPARRELYSDSACTAAVGEEEQGVLVHMRDKAGSVPLSSKEKLSRRRTLPPNHHFLGLSAHAQTTTTQHGDGTHEGSAAASKVLGTPTRQRFLGAGGMRRDSFNSEIRYNSCHDDVIAPSMPTCLCSLGSSASTAAMGRPQLQQSPRTTFHYVSGQPMQGAGLSKIGSASMSSLRSHEHSLLHSPVSPGPTWPSPVIRRISDLRDKLRKSTENLAEPALFKSSTVSPASAGYCSGGGVSRSKSYGNLYGTPDVATGGFSSPSLRKLSHSETQHFAGDLWGAREMTKSLGNLTKSGARSLGDTLRDMRSLSRGELDKVGLGRSRERLDSRNDDDDDILSQMRGGSASAREPPPPVSTSDELGSFYEKASTLPRSRRKSSGVAKKVEQSKSKGSAGGRVLRDDSNSVSTSESDSSYPRSRTAGNNLERSQSSVMGRGGSKALQLAQQFEKRGTGSSPQQQQAASKNYLMRLLEANGQLQPVGPPPAAASVSRPVHVDTWRSSSRGEPDQHSLKSSPSFDSDSNVHFARMSRHCLDSVGEFRTSLDRVLQAYQLVTVDPELCPEEREHLVATLSADLVAGHRRLSQTLGSSLLQGLEARAEPDGQNPTSPCPPVAARQPSAAGEALGKGGGGSDAPRVLLEQYSDMLVSMIQQKMQQQGGGGQKQPQQP